MISRFEFLYTKDKMKKIEDFLFEYKIRNEKYRAWERWNGMNAQEQDEIRATWDNYYNQCRNSYWGKSFFELYSEFKSFGPIREKIRKMLEFGVNSLFTKKPEGIDPDEIVSGINPYISLKYKLQELKKVYDEYKNVYEKQEATL